MKILMSHCSSKGKLCESFTLSNVKLQKTKTNWTVRNMIQLLFFLAAKWRSLEAYKLSNSFVILGNCECARCAPKTLTDDLTGISKYFLISFSALISKSFLHAQSFNTTISTEIIAKITRSSSSSSICTNAPITASFSKLASIVFTAVRASEKFCYFSSSITDFDELDVSIVIKADSLSMIGIT